MALHELKTWPTHFSAIKEGRKTFEVRKNDRYFQEGDELLLKEFTPKDYWDPEEPSQDEYSGSILHRRISYVLNGGQFGIEKGYVVLGLEKI